MPPNVRLSSEQEEHLRNSLDRNAPAVPDLLALADRPRGRHVVAFTPGVVMTPLTHLTRVERVSARGLSPLAHLAVQDGDVPRALAAFRARLNLGRSLHGEPLPLSQAAHDIVQLHRAVRDLERLLGHATLSPEQLAAVRRELAAELVYDPWLVAARGQRAIADRAITALRDGTVKASTVKTIALGRYTPTATERVGEWFNDHVAIETDAAHAAALDLCTREVATAALPWSERLPAVKALDADRATAPGPARWNVCGSGWWRTRLVYDRAHLHCAIAAVAVEQYRVAHGDWPPSLTALGEPLPDDPYTGQPLRFERTADGVVVYSVGPNGRDDGGTLSPESADSSSSDGDIGFRLWDVPRRNRPAGVGKP